MSKESERQLTNTNQPEKEKSVGNVVPFLREEARKFGTSDEELESMESMRDISLDQLNEKTNTIEKEIKELEMKIASLKHEKDKLSMKWLEDNPV